MILRLRHDLLRPIQHNYNGRSIAGAIPVPAPLHFTCLSIESSQGTAIVATHVSDQESSVDKRRHSSAVKWRGVSELPGKLLAPFHFTGVGIQAAEDSADSERVEFTAMYDRG